MGRTQDELDQYLSTEPDPVPNTEPPIAPGQGEWERVYSLIQSQFHDSGDLQFLAVVRAEHHAEAWRRIQQAARHNVEAEYSDCPRCRADVTVEAWRKVAAGLRK